MFPQRSPYGGRCSLSRASGLFIHQDLSESPVKEPSHEMGEKYGDHPQNPTWMEGLRTVGCSLVPLTELPQREMLRFQSPPSVS